MEGGIGQVSAQVGYEAGLVILLPKLALQDSERVLLSGSSVPMTHGLYTTEI